MDYLDDNSPMTLRGQHFGKPMSKVPDDYLLWVLRSVRRTPDLEPLFLYIEDNMDAINSNIKYSKPNSKRR